MMISGHRAVMLILGRHPESLIQGVVDYSRENDWYLVIQRGEDFINDLKSWDGDGVISGISEEILQCRSWENMALVSWSALNTFKTPYRLVREDDYAIGRLAAKYFLEKGYRKFAAHSESRRRDGFRDALHEAGYDCISTERQIRSNIKLSEWVKTLPKACAVFCENDWDAADLVNAAVWSGIKIPSELSVVGVGNDRLICNAPAVSISSVDSRLYELGRLAAQELDNQFHGISVPADPLYLAPAPMIAERRSSDFFAVDDKRLVQVLEFMKSNAKVSLSIHDIARHFSLSESTLYKLFTASLGISPKQFLLECRLKLVCEQLANSSSRQTIDAIALNSGFPTAGAMFSAFREKFGASPADWRKKTLARN